MFSLSRYPCLSLVTALALPSIAALTPLSADASDQPTGTSAPTPPATSAPSASTPPAGSDPTATNASSASPSAGAATTGEASMASPSAGSIANPAPTETPSSGGALVAESSVASAVPADETPWIRRYKPQRNLVELGIFGGFLRINDDHELFAADATKVNEGFARLNKIAPDFGLRAAYFPLSFLGIEAEGALLPTGLRDVDQKATLWSARGHLILQLPISSIVPFVAAGGGALGVSSKDSALGKDVDQAIHFGGGVKVNATKRLTIRADVRDVVTTSQGKPNKLDSHNLEVLLGLSLTLGRKDPVPPPAPPPSDRDGDKIIDSLDQCPDVPETVNGFQDEDGCPESDRDGDGFYDQPDQDKCPDVPGIAPDGCPGDRDGDGITDNIDKCPDQPETVNGYQDEDGCPDQMPQPVSAFTGFIPGIRFDFDSAELRPDSYPTLDQAAATLNQYTDAHVAIYGHTDAKGSEGYNEKLGQRRADAVRTYLIEHGVDASRLTAHSAGKREPVGANDNDDGRAQNRRIEFRISSKSQQPAQVQAK